MKAISLVSPPNALAGGVNVYVVAVVQTNRDVAIEYTQLHTFAAQKANFDSTYRNRDFIISESTGFDFWLSSKVDRFPRQVPWGELCPNFHYQNYR